MIVSFADTATEDLYHGRNTTRARRLPSKVADAAMMKLDMLDAAASLLDLVSPPGNRLEHLRGDMKTSCSIRVNRQWRIVFRWDGANAHDVRLIDYHR